MQRDPEFYFSSGFELELLCINKLMSQSIADQITIVITSCGRLSLLKETIKSFVEFSDIIPSKSILIENSGTNIDESSLENCMVGLHNPLIIINEYNMGQIKSIDKAYNLINTEYIFHLEDDWRFYDTDFMLQSLDVLQHNTKILNVNLRRRLDGSRGSMHPINPEIFKTQSETIYHTYQYNYINTYHGFSFNPGLRRLFDYKKIGLYQDYGSEEKIGDFYYKNGYQSACLEKGYCYHLAEYQTSLGANQ